MAREAGGRRAGRRRRASCGVWGRGRGWSLGSVAFEYHGAGHEPMQCVHCKSGMVRGTAPFSIERRGYQIRWDAVPAWICPQCGEPCFEAREVEALQRVLALVDRESAEMMLPAEPHPR